MADTVNIPWLAYSSTWRRSSDTVAPWRKWALTILGIDRCRQIHTLSWRFIVQEFLRKLLIVQVIILPRKSATIMFMQPDIPRPDCIFRLLCFMELGSNKIRRTENSKLYLFESYSNSSRKLFHSWWRNGTDVVHWQRIDSRWCIYCQSGEECWLLKN